VVNTLERESKTPVNFSTVQFEGLQAFTDAYAVSEDSFAFLSLFGSRVSVRAIWSALFTGSRVSLEDESLRLYPKGEWRVLQKLTPSGALHAVCFPDLIEIGKARDEFLVFGLTREDVEKRFFLYLDRISETPISREWGTWILRSAVSDGLAEWLKSLHLFALRYRHDESWLEDLVTGQLRRNGKVMV